MDLMCHLSFCLGLPSEILVTSPSVFGRLTGPVRVLVKLRNKAIQFGPDHPDNKTYYPNY